MRIGVLVITDSMLGILREYSSFDDLWFDRVYVQMNQAVENLHIYVYICHFTHLLVECPGVGTVGIDMTVEHVWYTACSSIDTDQLIKYVLVHDSFLQFELMKHIIGRLNVTELGTSFQHGNVCDLVGFDVFHVHLMPVLDSSGCVHW